MGAPTDQFGNYQTGLTSLGENDAVDPGVMSSFLVNKPDSNGKPLDSTGAYRPVFYETPENDPGPFTGGGSGGTEGHYGGVAPNFTPTSEPYFAVDLDTSRIWWYFGGAWH